MQADLCCQFMYSLKFLRGLATLTTYATVACETDR